MISTIVPIISFVVTCVVMMLWINARRLEIVAQQEAAIARRAWHHLDYAPEPRCDHPHRSVSVVPFAHGAPVRWICPDCGDETLEPARLGPMDMPRAAVAPGQPDVLEWHQREAEEFCHTPYYDLGGYLM